MRVPVSGGTFAALRVRNYRLFASGQVVSLVGTWMQRVAQDWLVLELSGGSPVALGVAAALQFGPTLLLSLWGGAIADRYDKRRLLIGLQIGMGACALVLGLLDVGGLVTLAQVYVLCVLLGCFSALDGPVRQSFAGEMVGSGSLANAVALNSMTFNAARILGPAVAGLLVAAVGTGWVFLLNAVTFFGMIVALLLIRVRELAPRVRTTGASRLADGFRYVGKRPDLMVTFAMVFLLGAFGMNFPIFASTMALEFGQGADGFGLLSSILAIGSLAGALLAARRDQARIRVVVIALLGFALASVASTLMPGYWSYAATLTLVGFAVVTVMTTANGYVQTTTDPALRGRVLALYMAVIMGGTPIGAPIVGWVAGQFGPRVAILVGATAALVAFLIGTTWLLTSGRLHRHEEKRFRLTIDETLPIAVLAPGREAFSEEVASTTPIRLPEGARGADRPPLRRTG
jgi:MFS family permease